MRELWSSVIGKHIRNIFKEGELVKESVWANSVLKQYIIKGYAENHNRIKQLGEVILIMKRTENDLDSKQVLSVIEKYNTALNLLDAYDHQNMLRPKGNEAIYVLTYDECIRAIQNMRFGDE